VLLLVAALLRIDTAQEHLVERMTIPCLDW
jgi:hypothetical protein